MAGRSGLLRLRCSTCDISFRMTIPDSNARARRLTVEPFSALSVKPRDIKVIIFRWLSIHNVDIIFFYSDARIVELHAKSYNTDLCSSLLHRLPNFRHNDELLISSPKY